MRPGMSCTRRQRLIMAWIALLLACLAGRPALAHHTDTHFEASSTHRIVYQLNKADPVYMQHVLFSAGELLRKYGDDIEIVISVFGPGLHLLARDLDLEIPAELQQRVTSLAAYGVAFHACGNTMKSLEWTAQDLLEFVKVVPIGVDDIMQLQEQGFTYISW